ncbi:hypothetical protein BpHYR1_047853 [Brachionus plicatilis]|uniref:Uncharacterized protein n=1 Tax=Brachionus plicatilis TaxID=10195 RepID=A0A3M7PRS2_BRAPC|nr:hypothetical protein BpHYR1_047853 [Brachionus plicatilis]
MYNFGEELTLEEIGTPGVNRTSFFSEAHGVVTEVLRNEIIVKNTLSKENLYFDKHFQKNCLPYLVVCVIQSIEQMHDFPMFYSIKCKINNKERIIEKEEAI